MEDGEVSRLDQVARDLASGEISRRAALRRFGAGLVAASLPGALFAESALGACPPSRKCGKKCCPKGAKCKKGKCKCTQGRKKCGNKCVDLRSDERHCGGCGKLCPAGQTCTDGQCVGGGGGGGGGPTCGNGLAEGTEQCDGSDLRGATCQSLGFLGGTLACGPNCFHDTSGCISPSCTTAADCPQGTVGDCKQPVCNAGTCGFANLDTDLPDDGNLCTQNVCTDGVPSHPPSPSTTACGPSTFCDGAGNCPAAVCGDGVISGTEECDGNDLGGEDCISLGFSGGTLACSGSCSYDTSGCTA